MRGPQVILVDLDGSVTSQPSLVALERAGQAHRIDATDLAARLRIVASRAAARALGERLAPCLARAGAPLIFYGSGDFHHLAAIFLSLLDEPVTVLHFDNHPDWVRFPPTLNCGGWVSRALALPQVQRVITVGPASDDLLRPELKGADLPALRAGRLEVHPWRGVVGPFWGRPVATPACRSQGRTLAWQGLRERCLDAFADELAARLPDAPLWVTLDKDVLTPAEAVTNWDQGGMSLDAVLRLIDRLARVRPVRGADVCGDFSVPRFADPFRWLLSATDRAARPAPTAHELAVNDRTNARLTEAFGRWLA